METLCDHGGDIVKALNATIYGNGTQTLVLVFDLAFSPNLEPNVYNPSKYATFDGYAQDLLYLNAKGYEGGFQRSDLDMIFSEINQNFSRWAHAFAPKAVGENDPAAISEFENSLVRMKPEVALSVAKTVFLSDLRGVLPRVQVPCTIIQSRKDIIVPESVAFYMNKKLGAKSKVRILGTKGHFPQLTAYPLLLKVLKRTLSIK
ncbi:strigolactone esterase D14-like [Senna tora]|uniref:Strigolactone esterase D14-like n=1 Tax=Senna tora TaxID=362788 RepID=A0A834VZR2_9FABA|nr:strigolactone esterase D14-like [Senna tora]